MTRGQKNKQAPAQDEREAFIAAAKHHKVEGLGFNLEATNSGSFRDNETRMLHEGWKLARSTRPAQTEQQPVAWRWMYNGEPDGPYAFNYPLPDDDVVQRGLMAERPRTVQPLYAAPIAQAAPLKPHQLRELVNDLRDVARKYHATEQLREQIAYTLRTALSAQGAGKFAMRQRVRKTSGSEWQGRICGTYSTALTPEGYAVESEAHAGSVQIYPAKALEAVE